MHDCHLLIENVPQLSYVLCKYSDLHCILPAARFASGRAIGIGQTRVVRLRKVSARPSTFEKCSSRSKWQCLGTPRRGRRDRRLRGNIAGEVVGKAPCARLAKEWAQRKLSTPPPARSHATDNALQAPAASAATSKTFTSSTSSTSSMNPLVYNVSYALYAASPLPMLGPGADVLRQESFRQGKAWSSRTGARPGLDVRRHTAVRLAALVADPSSARADGQSTAAPDGVSRDGDS